jgi:murein DD-endopeptidase MepM/ murein hydrolase activator NlpD
MKRRLLSNFLAAALSAGAAIPALMPRLAYACLQVPVGCPVTSAFGPRYNPVTKNFSSEFHHGVDFGCPIGTRVVAADAGVVNYAGSSNSAGNWVVTRTSGGDVIKYMHHERNEATMGSAITAGQEIARTGNSGRSTGPHLHFQLEVGGKAADPMARFCSKPGLKDGVLQGGPPPEGDTLDAGSQAAAPGDGGGVPPAMGLDGSLFDILGDVVASRALNPDYLRQLSTLSKPRLYAELAYMQTIRLKVQHERSLHRERIEATQAMLQLLRTEAVLRPQLESQRRAAAAHQ